MKKLLTGTRFTRDARTLVIEAQEEAERLGAPAVEAEHLLLALARRREPALEEAGLDVPAVHAALQLETEQALAVAGVRWDEPPPPYSTAVTPSFGASAKLALERSLPAALDRGDNRLVPAHVLLGILAAERGTVPRALALAGVDRTALAAAVRT